MPEYPLHLVPKKEDKIIEIGEQEVDQYLGVWVDESVRLKDSDGKLNAGVVNLDRLPHFSTNKIPYSILSDLDIKFSDEAKNIFNAIWYAGFDGQIPNEDEFEIVDGRQHYFLKILDIHNFSDKYLNPVLPESKQKTYEFSLKVIHKPLVSNYWHFEFAIYTNEGELKNAKGAWKQLLCSSIRDKIQQIAKLEIDQPEGLFP